MYKNKVKVARILQTLLLEGIIHLRKEEVKVNKVVDRRGSYHEQFRYPPGINIMHLWQVMNVVEPISYEQAKNHKEWNTAMNEEYESIMKNETWELT